MTGHEERDNLVVAIVCSPLTTTLLTLAGSLRQSSSGDDHVMGIRKQVV